MGMPVVITPSGGLPVVDATSAGLGVPMTVAENGFGTPVTIADNGFGLAAVFDPPLGPGPEPEPPENIVAPVVTGTMTVGSTLTVDRKTWTGTAPISYAYQWYSIPPPLVPRSAMLGPAFINSDGTPRQAYVNGVMVNL